MGCACGGAHASRVDDAGWTSTMPDGCEVWCDAMRPAVMWAWPARGGEGREMARWISTDVDRRMCMFCGGIERARLWPVRRTCCGVVPQHRRTAHLVWPRGALPLLLGTEGVGRVGDELVGPGCTEYRSGVDVKSVAVSARCSMYDERR